MTDTLHGPPNKLPADELGGEGLRSLLSKGRYLLISGHNSNQRNYIILQSIKSDQLLPVVNTDGWPGGCWCCWPTEYNGSLTQNVDAMMMTMMIRGHSANPVHMKN